MGPLARWRHASAGDLAHRLRWAAGVSVASAVIAPLVLQRWQALATGLTPAQCEHLTRRLAQRRAAGAGRGEESARLLELDPRALACL